MWTPIILQNKGGNPQSSTKHETWDTQDQLRSFRPSQASADSSTKATNWPSDEWNLEIIIPGTRVWHQQPNRFHWWRKRLKPSNRSLMVSLKRTWQSFSGLALRSFWFKYLCKQCSILQKDIPTNFECNWTLYVVLFCAMSRKHSVFVLVLWQAIETLFSLGPTESGLAGGLWHAVVGVSESAEWVPCSEAGSFRQVGQSSGCLSMTEAEVQPSIKARPSNQTSTQESLVFFQWMHHYAIHTFEIVLFPHHLH